MLRRLLLTLCISALAISGVKADDKPVKKLLLITDSGGFIHDSVGLAEQLLKELGPKRGWEVTCYRFTRDPNAMGTFNKMQRNVLEEYAERFRKTTGVNVDKESCGRVNKETLKKFDAILFFTTGNPLTKEETGDLVEWVKAGHGYAGTHCGSDTLYGEPEYGALVGGYFNHHPWHQKVKIVIEDPKHPAAIPFVPSNGSSEPPTITDEIYQFKAPYDREKLHIILSVDNSSIDTTKKDVERADKDFAISWCHEVGKGKSFYTSLGHRKEVWKDERFQNHLFAGLDWSVGRIPGDATPSAKIKK